MQYFYDGQIRRYLTQTIRVFSNFVVKYGDGTLHRIPVVYGDPDRQVANLMAQNSVSTLSAVPKIAIHITGLELDSTRLSDSTYVGKMHFRERGIDTENNVYTQGQGKNYTVERLMPTPFILTMKADIWTSSAEQKLQVLEQMLVFFNPTLEIQTTDNYIDWTSLSTLSLKDVTWSSRSVPVGTQDPIDVATLTVVAPIWISPPVKVKHLGVITSVITNIYGNITNDNSTYIEGLGQPLTSNGPSYTDLLNQKIVTVTDYQIQVFNNQAILLGKNENVAPAEIELERASRQGSTPISWETVFAVYPGEYHAGSSMLFLKQPGGSYVVGTVAINPTDTTILQINWNSDSLPSDTLIDSQGRFFPEPGYGTGTQYRSSPGNFDAIINPYKIYPGNGITDLETGDRFLIVEDIVDTIPAWNELNASANDIIEWTGTEWQVVFASTQITDRIVYQTNIYTGTQYIWNGVHWAKSYEGEYKVGEWQLEL